VASSTGFSVSCPSGASVRSCFQTVLANMRAQGVSGVRIFVTLCDSSSQALVNCGQPWTNVSWNPNVNPGLTWINNVNAFFTDVRNAGIQNVGITFVHDGPVYSLPKASTTPVGPNHCSDTPDPVYFNPTAPFGLKPAMNSYFPVGQDEAGSAGYNCAPVNPYFIGWNNQFNVVGAVLGAAQGKVTVSELEFEQEMNVVDFTVLMRLIYDNSNPQSAGLQANQTVDIVSRLRSLMTAHGFDPGRVAWSGVMVDPSVATDNCLSVYQDYARQFTLGGLASAIGAGYVGKPIDAVAVHGLWCGGVSTQSMFQSPIYNTQPNIVDVHMYPHVAGAGASDTQVQQVATLDFSDLTHFLAVVNLQSALVIIGETHSGTPYSGSAFGSPCVGLLFPVSAPSDTVAGYNASQLAGHSVVFRPWMELEDPSGGCYAYPTYQNVNLNGSGPYTPTLQ
jgi:hypothetical protein